MLRTEITQAGGWISFARFMELALYAPGLGYYANGLRKFGTLPSSGSDFVTAPELSPLFGPINRSVSPLDGADDWNGVADKLKYLERP